MTPAASSNGATACAGSTRRRAPRFNKTFVQAAEAERVQIVELVAWPARAAADLASQVSFFNRLRDLTASAFFSSRMGVEDLGYIGNVFNPNWQGAPEAALRELNVSYAEWDAKYGQAGRRAGGQGGQAGRRSGGQQPSTQHPTPNTSRRP